MKSFSKAMLVSIILTSVIAGCTLSTTGLRPPKDHSLAWDAITEVYDKPTVVAAPEPEPEPALACRPPSFSGSVADLRGCKAGEKIVLSGLNFGLDDASLNGQDKLLLDQVVVALKAAPAISFEIAGHTDDQGDAAYNLSLSQRRASAVMQYLLAQGIGSSRMTMKGYGETMPVADNATPDGRYQNRRVELVVAAAGAMGAMSAPAEDPHMMAHADEPAVVAPAPAASSAGTQVSIVDNAFAPEILTVAVGTTVTWTNDGGSNHIVTFADSASPRLRSGAQYSRTFDTAGEYAYECKIHGSRMSGQIIVSG